MSRKARQPENIERLKKKRFIISLDDMPHYWGWECRNEINRQICRFPVAEANTLRSIVSYVHILSKEAIAGWRKNIEPFTGPLLKFRSTL